MKGIDTLIRLSKRTLDELRKKQIVLENEKDKLLQALQKLGGEMQSEMKVAEKTPEMGAFFGGFAKRIKKRQEILYEEVKKLDVKLAELSEEILTAFADLKKYEITRDNANARAKAEVARKETMAMDEIAGVQFVRKEKEDQ